MLQIRKIVQFFWESPFQIFSRLCNLFSESKNLQNPILYANFKDDDLYLRHVMRSTEKLYPMLTSANWLDNEVKNYLQFRKIYVKNQVIDPDVFLIMSTLDVSKYVFIIYRKVSLISRYILTMYISKIFLLFMKIV